MAYEVYVQQRNGSNGPFVLRKLTPTANSRIGFDANKKLVIIGGDASVQALTAAGAVNLTTDLTTIATSGAIAITLADGAQNQRKTITMITDGGDATLTPAHLQGGTTLTFNDVGDTVQLVFAGTKWSIISNNGATLA
jgi:sugar (pentulose or hexulose) kinase